MSPELIHLDSEPGTSRPVRATIATLFPLVRAHAPNWAFSMN